jgi:hypothetical protein
MYSPLDAFHDLIEKIPEPATVRDRLALSLRDVQLLRQLLRLAERVAKDRERHDNARKEATTCR